MNIPVKITGSDKQELGNSINTVPTSQWPPLFWHPPPPSGSFPSFSCPLSTLFNIHHIFSTPFSADLLDWREVQSSQTFPWSVCHRTQLPVRVNRRSAPHITTSAPTWSTTYARYTAAPPSLWSQQPEDWVPLRVRFNSTPHPGTRLWLKYPPLMLPISTASERNNPQWSYVQ